MKEADLERDNVLSARLPCTTKDPGRLFHEGRWSHGARPIVRRGPDGRCVSGCVREKQHVHLNLAEWCFRGPRLPGTSAAAIHVFCGVFLL